MGMTMCEKILAAHAGRDSVAAGELLYCGVDIVMGNDITAPVAIGRFRERVLEGAPRSLFIGRAAAGIE